MSSSVQRWAGRLATALTASMLVAGAAHAGTVLFSQSALSGGNTYLSNGDNQNAENFTLQNAASVTALRWWGSELDVSQFVVRLYDNLPGAGDAYTAQTGVSGATVNKVSTGLFSVVDFVNSPIYEYELTLADAFSAQAGHEYYVSVFADGAVPWGWVEGQAGDGLSGYRAGDGTTWQFGAPDLSLAIIGDIAGGDLPEPASLTLTALALAAAAAAGRRRRVVG